MVPASVEMENVEHYIDNLFSINLIMISSPNAKNLAPNLTDLLKQFKSIKSLQATIREPSSDKFYPIHDLRIKLNEIKDIEARPNPAQVKKMLYDCVVEYNNNLQTLDGSLLDETPWYNGWKKRFLNNLESNDHEFIGAYVGVIFFIAEADLDNFREVLAKLQAEARSISAIKWFFPNFLKYCVVLSNRDVSPTNPGSNDFGPISTVPQAFKDLTAYLDSNKCFWFQVDPLNHNEQENEVSNQGVTDNFGHYNSFNHQDPLTFLSSTEEEDKYSEDSKEEIERLEETNPKPAFICQKTLGKCDRLLRQLLIRAVIPYCERQLGILCEALASRKGLRRSIFSATKQLLAMSSSTMNLKGTTQSIVYSLEANEMQSRKFADLAMCLGLHDVAYSYYYAARKEFQSEGAWTYYAGASESAAIASFMLNKFQKHYLDQAIVSYLEATKSFHLATRATLFATDAIRDISPNEAASIFIRLTSEESDLRSALFLEQAAKCFQLAVPSRKRKAAFHYVLAGNRYNRCGLKRLALACYLRYSSPHWSYAIEHVNYTVAKLYLQISNTITEEELRNIYRTRGMNLLQSNTDKQLFFTEFLKELKNRADDDSLVTSVNIPKVESITKCTIEGSYMKGPRQVCFLNEKVDLNLTLSSSFTLQLNNMRLICDNNEVNCYPLEVNLEANQGTTITCSLVPTIICDFNVIGLSFDIQGSHFVLHLSERLLRSLMFSCIKTLPPMDIVIQIGHYPENLSSIELYTGQMVDLKIKLGFQAEDINVNQYQAKLTTNGNLKGVENERPLPLSLHESNNFQFQAPFLPKIFSLFFKITYTKVDEPLKERSITRNIDLFVRECLQLDGLFHSVASLRNLSSSSSIILFSGENEKLEVGPGLTGHILAHDNFINWESNNVHGIINISL